MPEQVPETDVMVGEVTYETHEGERATCLADYQCEVCDEVGHHHEDYHPFCRHCDERADHGESQHRCHECGEQMRYCGYCSDCDNQSCCCTCRDEDEEGDQDGERIHDYAWQPPTIWYHGLVSGEPISIGGRNRSGHAHSYPAPPDSQPYLGLEIECEGIEGSPFDIAEVWNASELGWSKSDGSLRHGVECVSYPVTYARLEHDDMLPGVLRSMKLAGARAWEPGNCGLHIHVSRPAFAGKSHQWRFAAAHEAMAAVLQQMSGRDGNEGYCSWERTDRQEYILDAFGMPILDAYGRRQIRVVKQGPTKLIAGKIQSMDRYVSVNVTAGTIELRYWRGSMAASHVLGAAALEDGLFQWTRSMRVQEVRTHITQATADGVWVAFQRWAVENLPALQVKRIVKLANKRGVKTLTALVRAAYAAEGGDS